MDDESLDSATSASKSTATTLPYPTSHDSAAHAGELIVSREPLNEYGLADAEVTYATVQLEQHSLAPRHSVNAGLDGLAGTSSGLPLCFAYVRGPGIAA